MDNSLFATDTFGLRWVWRHASPSHLVVVPRSAPKQSGAHESSYGPSLDRRVRLVRSTVGWCRRAQFWAPVRGVGVPSFGTIKSIQEVQAGSRAWSFGSSALPRLGLPCVSFTFTVILVRAFQKLASPDALVLPCNLLLKE